MTTSVKLDSTTLPMRQNFNFSYLVYVMLESERAIYNIIWRSSKSLVISNLDFQWPMCFLLPYTDYNTVCFAPPAPQGMRSHCVHSSGKLTFSTCWCVLL